MKSGMLKQRMTLIQNEYKNLLLKIIISIKGENFFEAVDNINVFWFRNMDAVRLYLKSEVAGKDSFVFTAATFLDLDDNEQYPFLLLGSQHILDDSLCKYSSFYNSMPKRKISKKLFEQIGLAAEDNIKVIENCNNLITILPFRILTQRTMEPFVKNISELFFISLFDGIESIKDFFEKCTSFDDIIKFARKDIGKRVFFPGDDDMRLPFDQRFIKAKAEQAYIADCGSSDIDVFFLMVFGNIQQAADVITSCVEYECIPYIRYKVALNYILLLLNAFSEMPFIHKIRYKMCVANILYRISDKQKLKKSGYNKFVASVTKLNFDKMLFSTLNQHGVTENNFTVGTTAPLISECLSELYDAIE